MEGNAMGLGREVRVADDGRAEVRGARTARRRIIRFGLDIRTRHAGALPPCGVTSILK